MELPEGTAVRLSSVSLSDSLEKTIENAHIQQARALIENYVWPLPICTEAEEEKRYWPSSPQYVNSLRRFRLPGHPLALLGFLLTSWVVSFLSYDSASGQKWQSRRAAIAICGCGKKFYSRSYYNKHIRWQCRQEPSFFCAYCDYKTFWKSKLKRHEMCHIRKELMNEMRCDSQHFLSIENTTCSQGVQSEYLANSSNLEIVDTCSINPETVVKQEKKDVPISAEGAENFTVKVTCSDKP
ncbi:unnamed protein product [Nesidiocoris tenuis]|uniref:C2H2-type domain-containing protein n=1 Tax=Nesidiocoris tenuis TaxID=355587 RepID=A0A6H5G1S2_9HEMI|nr:unnamed protein product [Nesidiocoris tenuis]